MTRGRTRHVLAAVLVALAVLAGCGGSDDEPAEAGSGTTAGDGGSGGSSGSDEGDGGDADEVTLALERVADLDPASLGSTASDDEAIYTLAYADGETTLRRIATDGTVEDLAGAGPSASLFSLFSTSEGVFATLSDQAGTCGYAPIDRPRGPRAPPSRSASKETCAPLRSRPSSRAASSPPWSTTAWSSSTPRTARSRRPRPTCPSPTTRWPTATASR